MATPISSRLLLQAIDRSLRIEVNGAAVTAIAIGHTTGWRTLPGCTTAHLLEITNHLDRLNHPPLVINSGEAFILAPNLHHRSTVIAGSGVSRWSLFDCLIFGSVPVMSLIEVPLVLTGRTAKRLGDLNCALGQTMHDPAPGLQSTLRKHAQAFELVQFLVELGNLRPDAEALLMHAERMAPVLQHIERHLQQPVSRAGLAKVAGLSPSRFHALFRATMGMSPMAYALQRRLQHASYLLIGSDLTVQDVSSRLGFSDPFYFSRIFKSRMHLSPVRYRQQTRNGLG
jgi:AraC-like DNA-binding protein